MAAGIEAGVLLSNHFLDEPREALAGYCSVRSDLELIHDLSRIRVLNEEVAVVMKRNLGIEIQRVIRVPRKRDRLDQEIVDDSSRAIDAA